MNPSRHSRIIPDNVPAKRTSICDLCGSTRSRLLPKYMTGLMRIVICSNCALIYTCPRLAESAVKRLYRTKILKRIAVVKSKTGWDGQQLERELDAGRVAARREVLPLIQRHVDPHGRSFLDVRPEFGALLAELRNLGAEVEGHDLFPSSADWIRSRLGLVIHVAPSVHDFWRPVDRRFDAISMLSVDVLAHMPSPSALLRGAYDRLVPGGVLFAAEVDVRYISKDDPSSPLRYPNAMAHFHHFTPRSVVAFVQKSRFEILETGNLSRFPGRRKWFFVVARRPRSDANGCFPRIVYDDPGEVYRDLQEGVLAASLI